MTKRELKIIQKWSKLRCPDSNWKKFAVIAQGYYNTLTDKEKNAMLQEFDSYILKVQKKEVISGPVEIIIPKL